MGRGNRLLAVRREDEVPAALTCQFAPREKKEKLAHISSAEAHCDTSALCSPVYCVTYFCYTAAKYREILALAIIEWDFRYLRSSSLQPVLLVIHLYVHWSTLLFVGRRQLINVRLCWRPLEFLSSVMIFFDCKIPRSPSTASGHIFRLPSIPFSLRIVSLHRWCEVAQHFLNCHMAKYCFNSFSR